MKRRAMDQLANITPEDITAFWKQAGPKLWFEKSDEFDQQIKHRFGPLPEKAATGALDHWMKSPAGALALILVLDQFPRNIHRGSAMAWQYDEIAREKSKAAIDAGHDKSYDLPIKRFSTSPICTQKRWQISIFVLLSAAQLMMRRE